MSKDSFVPSPLAFIFQDVFKGISSPSLEISKIGTYKKDVTAEVFYRDFMEMIRHYLTLPEKCPESVRILQLISKFLTSRYVLSENQNKTSESISEVDSLFTFILGGILSFHNAHCKQVRLSVCTLIGEILFTMQADADIEEVLSKALIKNLLERLFDKYAKVRQRAVKALSRLQDANDSNCPVIKNFLRLMQSEVNPEVRREILENISLTPLSISIIIEKLLDPNKAIRSLVYRRVCQGVGIKYLTISQRVFIVKQGMEETESEMKTCVNENVIRNWFSQCQSSVIQLVDLLICDESDKHVHSILKILFSDSEDLLLDCVKEISLLFSSGQKMIKNDKLTRSAAIMWSRLVLYCKQKRKADLLDCILPEISEMCQYIGSYIKDTYFEDEMNDMTKIQDHISIGTHLFSILTMMDRSDEGGRKFALNNLLQLLTSPHLCYELVDEVINAFHYFTIRKTIVDPLCEIIAEIQNPIFSTTSQQVPPSSTAQVSQSFLTEFEEDKENKMEVARLRVEILTVKTSLEEAIDDERYETAAELKLRLSELEEKRRKLSNPRSQVPQPELEAEDIEETKTHPQVDRLDAAVLRKCLSIALAMLKRVRVDFQSPLLSSLTASLILPSIQNVDPAVRECAVKCLGLMCIRSKELANKYLILLSQIVQVDVEMVQAAAMSAIFDMLLVFGLDCLKNFSDAENLFDNPDEEVKQTDDNAANEGYNEELADAADSIISIISEFLDHENNEIRLIAIEGIAKLLLLGRISSSHLLARLVLIWFNPINAEDEKLRQTLAAFFPLFCYASARNQDLFAQSAMIALKTVFSAKESSPLRKIKIISLCDFFVQLTALANRKIAKDVAKKQDDGCNKEILESNSHDTMVVEILNEIILSNDPEAIRTFSRMLSTLTITYNNATLVRDISSLMDTLKIKVRDKLSMKSITKFENLLKLYQISENITTPSENDIDDKTEFNQPDENPNANILAITDHEINPDSTMAPNVEKDSSECESKDLKATSSANQEQSSPRKPVSRPKRKIAKSQAAPTAATPSRPQRANTKAKAVAEKVAKITKAPKKAKTTTPQKSTAAAPKKSARSKKN